MMNQNQVKLIIVLFLNVFVFALMLIIQSYWLNHIETAEFEGQYDGLMRNVAFMNATSSNSNTALSASLILMLINMLLLRSWVGIKRWILYPILFAVISLVASFALVILLLQSFY